MSSGTILLSDASMLDHDPGPGHPERPDRLRAIRRALDEADFAHVRWAAPQPAAPAALVRIHERAYLEHLASLRGSWHALESDTQVSPASYDAALLAAGAAMDGVTAVITGSARSAFALVRPPGHHAERAAAMGFCLINNIAAAATRAIELGCQRVLIVDWDVHHGNGTQSMFYQRRDVLHFDIHQWPLYPGSGGLRETGEGEGAGYTVNVPLPAGQRDEDYLSVLQHLLVPVAEVYAPDIVLVSAGFDAHRADPLGGMLLSADGFASMLAIVRDIAERLAGGRLVLVLEGGYDLRALAHSARACVAGLAPGASPQPLIEPAPLSPSLGMIMQAHRRHWPCV